MNPWDFEPLTTIFGHTVEIARLEPGDIFCLRPSHPTSQHEIEYVRERVGQMLPRGVTAMVVPFDWEIAVARPISEQTVIDGLRGLVEDLQ